MQLSLNRCPVCEVKCRLSNVKYVCHLSDIVVSRIVSQSVKASIYVDISYLVFWGNKLIFIHLLILRHWSTDQQFVDMQTAPTVIRCCCARRRESGISALYYKQRNATK